MYKCGDIVIKMPWRYVAGIVYRVSLAYDDADKCKTNNLRTEEVRRSEGERTVRRYMFAWGLVSKRTKTGDSEPRAWKVPAATMLLIEGSTPLSTLMRKPSLITLVTQFSSMGLPALKTSWPSKGLVPQFFHWEKKSAGCNLRCSVNLVEIIGNRRVIFTGFTELQ